MSALVAVAQAGVISGPATVAVAPALRLERLEHLDSHHPQYSFSYSVADGLTGDYYSQSKVV